MKDYKLFEKNLEKAFLKAAEIHGDEVFKMSIYAKYGAFAHLVNENLLKEAA